MRIERAIDAYLDWRQLERDATLRSQDSYRRILNKLAEDYPEAPIEGLTTQDLRGCLRRWQHREASTRSNVISVFHSFFKWAEAEDLVEIDPSRKIRRPPKRKPNVYRPSLDELHRVRDAAVGHERPAILLMEGAGLRRSEVLRCRWEDIDLFRGRVRLLRKGRHWQVLPLDPDVLDELRKSYRELQPEPDDHVFTVEVEQWANATERERRRKDPKRAASEQALWRLTQRVSKRAGLRPLSPHQLRHGFANRFIRESGRDFVALQRLMGHSRPDTTQNYTDDLDLDDLADALAVAAKNRDAQASPERDTESDEAPEGLEVLEWRRRESNPRKVPAGRARGCRESDSRRRRDQARAGTIGGRVAYSPRWYAPSASSQQSWRSLSRRRPALLHPITSW